MPDIDSHSSKSKRIIFNFLALVSIYLYYVYFSPTISMNSGAKLIALYVFVRYGLSWILFKFSVHRGIFHSIPVMLIWAFGSGLLIKHIWKLSSFNTWLVAATISAGFLSHLLLDEIYSVNLVGLKLKKSFGSALKFYSSNTFINFFVYVLALGLLFMMPNGHDLLNQLSVNVQNYWTKI